MIFPIIKIQIPNPQLTKIKFNKYNLFNIIISKIIKNN